MINALTAPIKQTMSHGAASALDTAGVGLAMAGANHCFQGAKKCVADNDKNEGTKECLKGATCLVGTAASWHLADKLRRNSSRRY